MIDIALFSKRVKECRENIGLTVRSSRIWLEQAAQT